MEIFNIFNIFKKKTFLEKHINTFIKSIYIDDIFDSPLGLSIIKENIGFMYSEDKEINTKFIIFFILNFKKIKKDNSYINKFNDKKYTIINKSLNFVKEQMGDSRRTYHNILHVYDVIENIAILLLMIDYYYPNRDYFMLATDELELISLFMAAIFHDVFYSYDDSIRDNNEYISYTIFENFFLGIDQDLFKKEFNINPKREVTDDIKYLVMDCIYSTIISNRESNLYDDNSIESIMSDADILSNCFSVNNTRDISFNISNEISNYSYIETNFSSEDICNFLKKYCLDKMKSVSGKMFNSNISDIVYELSE